MGQIRLFRVEWRDDCKQKLYTVGEVISKRNFPKQKHLKLAANRTYLQIWMVEKDWKNLRSGNGKNMNPILPRCVSHFTYGDYFTLLRSLPSFFNMNWKFNLNFSRSRKKMKTEIQLFKMILMLAHSLLRHNVKTMISNSVWCYLIEFECFTQTLSLRVWYSSTGSSMIIFQWVKKPWKLQTKKMSKPSGHFFDENLI